MPIIVGELGSYSNSKANWALLNNEISKYVAEDKNCRLITTKDLRDKGDHIHFDSEGQREMGKRFAEAWFENFYKK